MVIFSRAVSREIVSLLNECLRALNLDPMTRILYIIGREVKRSGLDLAKARISKSVFIVFLHFSKMSVTPRRKEKVRFFPSPEAV